MACLVVVAMFLSTQVPAQTSACGQTRGKLPAALDEATWKRLNDIYEDVGEENYDSAFSKLQKMNARVGGDYQRAVVAQALAQVEWSRSNYDTALASFELAVELNALPDEPHFSLMYQIAQLYYMNERYAEALDKLDLWMCMVPSEKITDSSFVLKASIYAQSQDWKNVIPAIDSALSLSLDPQKSWYQLKLVSQFELEQFSKAAQTLEILIQNWPDNKDYWLQLSQIYYKLNRQDEALSVLALAYRLNMLDKQTDIMYLSSLYSNTEVPYKAASVLQKGIEDGIVVESKRHWSIVADAWFAAEEMENALAAYQHAGRASDDGEIDLRRAYILVDMERWEEASVAIKAALGKGGFDQQKTGEAYVLQGMSEFNLGNYSEASAAWERATRYSKSKKSAEQWMNHMREERSRRSS